MGVPRKEIGHVLEVTGLYQVSECIPKPLTWGFTMRDEDEINLWDARVATVAEASLQWKEVEREEKCGRPGWALV